MQQGRERDAREGKTETDFLQCFILLRPLAWLLQQAASGCCCCCNTCSGRKKRMQDKGAECVSCCRLAGDGCLSQFVSHQIALNALFRSPHTVCLSPFGLCIGICVENLFTPLSLSLSLLACYCFPWQTETVRQRRESSTGSQVRGMIHGSLDCEKRKRLRLEVGLTLSGILL